MQRLEGIANLCFNGKEQSCGFQILNLKVTPLEEMSEEGHVGLKLLQLQSIRVLRELDGDSHRQFVFLALLRVLVLDSLSL